MNPPEARQNLIAESDQFGSSAVQAGEDRWLIGNPKNGAHWATDADVKDWTPLVVKPAAPAAKTAPAK